MAMIIGMAIESTVMEVTDIYQVDGKGVAKKLIKTYSLNNKSKDIRYQKYGFDISKYAKHI